jgi:hypothetical protein
MFTGEITYNDLMHSDKDTAYYKVGFIILVLLAIIMTILVSNLLISKNDICFLNLYSSISLCNNIGLAVGEIGPLMAAAKDTRLDMFYQLAADFEILKLQLILNFNRCCHCWFIRPRHYKQSDLAKQWKWLKNLKKRLLVSCAREVDNDDLSDAVEDEDTDYPTKILEEVRKELQQLHNKRPNTALRKAGPSKAITGTKPVKLTNKK